MSISAARYHDCSMGHRVHNHESKCALLHGHNYRIHFHVRSIFENGLDPVGRVLDFSVINTHLCQWVERNWDHHFLAWEKDPFMHYLVNASEPPETTMVGDNDAHSMLCSSIVWVPFNPTAENIANHLLRVIGPEQLSRTTCELFGVVVEETRKCLAEAWL